MNIIDSFAACCCLAMVRCFHTIIPRLAQPGSARWHAGRPLGCVALAAHTRLGLTSRVVMCATAEAAPEDNWRYARYASMVAKGPSSTLEGAPENGDRTSDLSHRRAARTACQALRCRRAITCVYCADKPPRFDNMSGALGPRCCGRGDARSSACRPRQLRVRAASRIGACVGGIARAVGSGLVRRQDGSQTSSGATYA